MITIAIIISTIIEHIKSYIQEIPAIARNTTQVAKSVITKVNRTGFMQNIRESYRTARLAVTIATSATNHTSHTSQQQTNNNNKQNPPGMQKPDDQHDGSYQSHTSRTHSQYYNQ